MDLLSDLIDDPKIAPLKYRICASIIDFFILAIILAIIGIFWGESYSDGDSWGVHVTGLPAFALFLIFIVLIPMQEGLTGQTIGKRIVKIKVKKADMSEMSISASIARHLFDSIDMMLLVGLIIAASTAKKQRIGDLVAKTIVVMDRN